MSKISSYIKHIGGIIIILLAFIGGCSLLDSDNNTTEIIKTSTVVDTVYNTVTDTIYKASPSLIVEVLVHDTIIQNKLITRIDTVNLVKEFFTKRFYSDTLVIDEYGYVVIEDTIYNNDIQNREYLYSINVPNIIVTNTIEKTLKYEPNRFRSFVFGDISISEDQEWSRPLRVGGGLQYAPIKNNYIGISGDIVNRDILATYDLNTERVGIGAAYSINNQYLDISAKYWITK